MVIQDLKLLVVGIGSIGKQHTDCKQRTARKDYQHKSYNEYSFPYGCNMEDAARAVNIYCKVYGDQNPPPKD